MLRDPVKDDCPASFFEPDGDSRGDHDDKVNNRSDALKPTCVDRLRVVADQSRRRESARVGRVNQSIGHLDVSMGHRGCRVTEKLLAGLSLNPHFDERGGKRVGGSRVAEFRVS